MLPWIAKIKDALVRVGAYSPYNDADADAKNADLLDAFDDFHGELTATAASTAAAIVTAEAYADAGDATTLGLVLKKDGSVALTGDQSFGSHKATNVADGTVSTDGVNKGQLDAGDALGILKDGTRAFTGDQSMGSHKLTNVTDPASAQDAATKNYADGKVAKSTMTTKGDILAATAASTPARVGVSGNNGYLLTEDSSASEGVAFKQGPAFDWQFVGTGVLNNRYTVQAGCQTPSTIALSVNTLYAVPFWIPRKCTIDVIDIEITTVAGAGGKIRFGIYDSVSRTNPSPNNLLVDSGEKDATAGGGAAPSVRETASLSVAIPGPGVYWFAVLCGTAAPTLRGATTASIIPVLGWPSTLGSGPYSGVTQSYSYAALPSTFGAITPAVAGVVPLGGYRVSA